MQILIREGTLQDLPFLYEMLYEAVYWRLSVNRPSPQDGLTKPEIARLIDGWGRENDTVMIAESVIGQPVGAAWYRYWNDNNHSYGYISDEIPVLVLALRMDWRRQGIGSTLLFTLKQQACEQRVKYLSLSVEKDNPAHNLFFRHGFRPVGQVGNNLTMMASIMS